MQVLVLIINFNLTIDIKLTWHISQDFHYKPWSVSLTFLLILEAMYHTSNVTKHHKELKIHQF